MEYLVLNREFKFDSLEIFRSDFLNKLFSKKSQNHYIDTKNVYSINKLFYELNKKQINK